MYIHLDVLAARSLPSGDEAIVRYGWKMLPCASGPLQDGVPDACYEVKAWYLQKDLGEGMNVGKAGCSCTLGRRPDRAPSCPRRFLPLSIWRLTDSRQYGFFSSPHGNG